VIAFGQGFAEVEDGVGQGVILIDEDEGIPTDSAWILRNWSFTVWAFWNI
jgi:hypothetical protein